MALIILSILMGVWIALGFSVLIDFRNHKKALNNIATGKFYYSITNNDKPYERLESKLYYIADSARGCVKFVVKDHDNSITTQTENSSEFIDTVIPIEKMSNDKRLCSEDIKILNDSLSHFKHYTETNTF